MTHMVMFRLTNMLHMSHLDIQTKINIVQKVRNEYLIQNPSSNSDCMNYVMLSDQTTEELIKKVDEILNLNKTIPEKHNLDLFEITEQSRQTLQTGAEMFIFLNYCPPKGSVKSIKLLNQISINIVHHGPQKSSQ